MKFNIIADINRETWEFVSLFWFIGKSQGIYVYVFIGLTAS